MTQFLRLYPIERNALDSMEQWVFISPRLSTDLFLQKHLRDQSVTCYKCCFWRMIIFTKLISAHDRSSAMHYYWFISFSVFISNHLQKTFKLDLNFYFFTKDKISEIQHVTFFTIYFMQNQSELIDHKSHFSFD